MSAVAVDLGATSGRVAVGRLAGGLLDVTEVHRFPNDPVWLRDRLYWDFLRLVHEVRHGLIAAHHSAPDGLHGFGIDSWGLDLGLLDRNDHLLGNPRHYRDATDPVAMEWVRLRVSQRELYDRTGIQDMPINTLYQLASFAAHEPETLDRARTLLQIPDLIRFFLTGERGSEYTNATTTQFLSLATGDWDRDLLDRLDIPSGMLQPIVRAPQRAGALRPSVQRELGLPPVPAIVVGEHDTASAVAAVPAEGEFVFLSCGTWSLLGTERVAPIAGARAMAWNVTNEGGLSGTVRLLKNIAGLWLVEQCRRIWDGEGRGLSWEEASGAIAAAPPFAALIDPDHDDFLNPVSMPAAIQRRCRESGQGMIEKQGSVLRCIHESLALKVRYVLEGLEDLVGRRFAGLHIVGGGAHNRVLCQFIASALGRPVWAGPAEATTVGNILAQLMATGEIAGLAEARALVRASFPLQVYEPRDESGWAEAYARFCPLIAATASGQTEDWR